MNYGRYIDKEKIQFDYLVFEMTDAPLLQDLMVRGSNVYHMPALSPKNIIKTVPQALDVFFAEHEGEYDIVHGHIPNAAFLYFEAAKKHGIERRILHSHNARGADGMAKKIRNRVLNLRAVELASEYMACSELAGEYLFGKKTVEQGRVQLLHNAINTSAYAFRPETREQKREELGLTGKFVMGHVGRFCEQKNHKYLLEIFRALVQKQPNAHLLLLGGGKLESEVRQQAEAYGLADRISFLGVRGRVCDYLQTMDAFVLPSLYEGLPVVCVEAQTSGLPCIISDTVSSETRLSDRLSYLSLKDSPTVWAERILREAERWNPENRAEGEKEVAAAGYDIRQQCQELQAYYMKNLAENGEI